MGENVREFSQSKYPIGANMAFSADVFRKYGNFNTSLGRRADDKDMAFRLRKFGQKVYYVPYIHVRHIIPESRTQMDHIKKQAIGVGKSEKIRLKDEGAKVKLKKIIEEIIKIVGSIVLAFYYLFTFRPEISIMLLRFRVWIIQGYFSTSE
jgi:GT2 family glycosyltransferase